MHGLNSQNLDQQLLIIAIWNQIQNPQIPIHQHFTLKKSIKLFISKVTISVLSTWLDCSFSAPVVIASSQSLLKNFFRDDLEFCLMSGCFSGVSINYIKKERLSFIYLENKLWAIFSKLIYMLDSCNSFTYSICLEHVGAWNCSSYIFNIWIAQTFLDLILDPLENSDNSISWSYNQFPHSVSIHVSNQHNLAIGWKWLMICRHYITIMFTILPYL